MNQWWPVHWCHKEALGHNELTSYLQSEADTFPVDSLSVDLKLGSFVLIMHIQDFYQDSKSPIPPPPLVCELF